LVDEVAERALQFQTVGEEGAGGLLRASRWSRRDQSRAPGRGARVACDKPAIMHSADSLACGVAGRDKSPPGYGKQFARHGQAFYRPSWTLLSKLFTTRPSLLDCAVKMTAAFAF